MDSKINAHTRRSFLKRSSLLLAATQAGGILSLLPARSDAQSASSLFSTTDTTTGKVQGFDIAGIKTFYGIPYGAPTGGKNRYMPPQKVMPWKGVKETMAYGQISPQTLADPTHEYERAIEWDLQTGGMGEDCLVLNLWTPALNDGGKRPVMVSLHGGGFATGSASEPAYYGDALARLGNVVVVTINHRLSSFGYLHLAGLGAPPEFESAGNTGTLDIVASLQWIHDNIENFGGDPSRVTIFGQSGGGAKVSTMMAVPSAKGLFHRAGVQSGSSLRMMTPEAATASAEKLLKQLGIDKGKIADLQKIPWQQVLEAQTAVGTGTNPVGFSPVVDGKILPQHPFDPAAPAFSADVPMIISTTLDDAGVRLSNYTLDDAGLKALLSRLLESNADRVLAMYKKTYPDLSPFLLQARILTDRGRGNSVKQALRKAALGKAPAYMYLWEWPSPAFEGKFGAIHGTDVAMVFHEPRQPIDGDGPVARRLADIMSPTWVSFAATGDPNNAAIPHWAPYDEKTRTEMVCDANPHSENDPRREFRLLWEEIGASASPLGT